METCRMEFSGKLLKRGFWLYIWDIKEDRKRHLYVGRTGDSSSPNASSPFRRIGQHLDHRAKAKGNALGRQLMSRNINPETCTFEMTAIGPIFDEQKSMPDHVPLRDKTAALEGALAEELKRRGYDVLGNHPSSENPDPFLLEQIISKLQAAFPESVEQTEVPRLQPIHTKNGELASTLIMSDRGRL